MSLETAEKNLRNVLKLLEQDNMKERLSSFLITFMLCESCYKDLLKAYKRSKGETFKEANLTIKMQEVTAVLKKFKIQINNEVIQNIFSSTGDYRNAGSRSAKVLRNAVVHSMNKGAIQEIFDRCDDLDSDMNVFLQYFKTNNADHEASIDKATTKQQNTDDKF